MICWGAGVCARVFIGCILIHDLDIVHNTVFMGERSSFSKLFFVLGATIGALFGLGFAQRKGEELRKQLRSAAKSGKNPAEAIAKDLLAAGKEVMGELEKLSEQDGIEEIKKKISMQTRRLGEAASRHLLQLEKDGGKALMKAARNARKAASRAEKKAKKAAVKKFVAVRKRIGAGGGLKRKSVQRKKTARAYARGHKASRKK